MYFDDPASCALTRSEGLLIVLAQRFEELETVGKTHANSIIAGFTEFLYVSGEACLAPTPSKPCAPGEELLGGAMPNRVVGARHASPYLVRCPVDFESRRRTERTRVELPGPLGGGFFRQPGQSFLGYACIAQVVRQSPSLGQLSQASR